MANALLAGVSGGQGFSKGFHELIRQARWRQQKRGGGGGGGACSDRPLLRQVGDAKSHAEEVRIIANEAATLRSKLAEADSASAGGAPCVRPRCRSANPAGRADAVSGKAMRELLLRLIYVEMLGRDASFGYIYAIKLTQSHNILEKRTGYLVASLFLHENHELRLLLINTIQVRVLERTL